MCSYFLHALIDQETSLILTRTEGMTVQSIQYTAYTIQAVCGEVDNKSICTSQILLLHFIVIENTF